MKGCCDIVVGLASRSENDALIGLAQTCRRVEKCVEHLRQIVRRGLMMLRTSAVAFSCCRASFSSLVSRATFVSRPGAKERRGRAAFDATRVLRATVLRRGALAGSPPALDRRRIAAPRLRTRHRGEVSLAHWSMVRHNLSWADQYAKLQARRILREVTQELTVLDTLPD